MTKNKICVTIYLVVELLYLVRRCIIGKLKVDKSNELIDCNSKHYFSKFELQFIANAISKVSMLNKDILEMEVEVDNLYEECYGSVLDGSSKVRIIDSLRELKDKYVIVKDINDNSKHNKIKWLSKFDYSYKTKMANIIFEDDVLDYILNLSKSFTKIDRDIYMSMDTSYGIRLMELMSKIYGNTIITREFTIDELRELLHSGDKYNRNYRFKTMAVDKAVKDINKNNPRFNLSYEVIKKGRNLNKFKFTKYDINEY